MKIQHISDIHLEFCSTKQLDYLFPNFGDVLVLAGDIGYPCSEIYQKFIEKCSQLFKYVIIIFGNHEYYQLVKHNNSMTMEEIENYTSEYIKKFANVYLLKDSFVEINNVIFYGTTLWTDIPVEKAPIIEYLMNDYNNIFISKNKLLRVTDVTKMFWSQLNQMLNFLEKHKHDNKSIIIVTHHCPLYNKYTAFNNLNNNKKRSMKNEFNDKKFAYYNDLDELIKEYGNIISAWIYGHTHIPCNIKINNMILTSNPKGYPQQLYKSTTIYDQYPVALFNV